MKVFYSYQQVREAVKVIKEIMKTYHSLPDVLVKSYKEALANGYKGVVIKFYETLQKECPEALPYFGDVESERYKEGK